MKVLHVTFAFMPDPPGGTEIYVDGLARALTRLGVCSVVAAPGPRDERYELGGLSVRRFACAPEAQSLDVLYGAGDPGATEAFERVLLDERPDVVHQHALSPACSADLVHRARRHGIPVVFTYHTPTVSCQRGTLLRFGTEVCAGRIDEHTCTPCVLEDLGLNRVVRGIVENLPISLGRSLGRRGLSGGAWTALRVPALMRRRLEAVRGLLDSVDRFVSLAPWVTRLLEINGVAPSRITCSLHGVIAREGAAAGAFVPSPDGAIRLAHLGRVDPTKGTAILIRAIVSRPEMPVRLDVYGVLQAGADRLGRLLRELAGEDTRIRFLPPVAHRDVIPVLAAYDAVVVPSQWVETGPLVVLESFAAGVPVLASELGGIAEKVRHEVDGLLVPAYQRHDAWAGVLERCVSDRALLPRLRAGVMPPRSMTDVAREMADVYEQVAASRHRAAEMSTT